MMIPFVVSILVKATAITLLAIVATRLARRSRAAVRHVLLAAAFAALLAVPVASFVVPPVAVEVPIVAVAPTAVPVAGVGRPGAVTSAPIGDADIGVARDAGFAPLPLLAALWATGVAVFLLPVAFGLWQVRALRASGLPWRKGKALAGALAADADMRRPVEILLHESMAGPMTCGVLRPAIILPLDARSWDDEDLARAFVHELEHVRRADWLTQCAARVACACYWFHPLVWIAWRGLVLEAERACDDAVLRRAEATAYADQLVELARRLSAAANRPVLAMANRADLAARVGAVLDAAQPRGRAGAPLVALACAAAALVILAISPLRLVAAASLGQQTANGERFEIVSIKPCLNEPVTPPGQRSSQGGFPVVSPGRLFIECGTVERLIGTAYVQNGEPLANQAARIGDVAWAKGLPDWVRNDKFTIEAKAEGTPDKNVILGPMLRALLEDRFKLKIHRDTDQAPMYEMTVASSGLKTHPIGEDGCTRFDPADPPGREEMQRLSAGPKPVCGNMNMMRSEGLMRWTIGGTTMEQFAGTLSAFMDRHVIDRTHVEGEFNVRLEFALDEHVPGADKRPRAGPPAMPADAPSADGPTIFAALEQQLGLKLSSARGEHGFLVIDHVEHPTPNTGPRIFDAPGK